MMRTFPQKAAAAPFGNCVQSPVNLGNANFEQPLSTLGSHKNLFILV